MVFGLVLEHVQTGFLVLYLLEKETPSLCTSLVKEFHGLYLRKAPLPDIDCERNNLENIRLGEVCIGFSRRMVTKFLKLPSLAPTALAEK